MGCEFTNQKLIHGLRHLILRSGDGYYITRHFGGWKIDFAIPFLLKLFDFWHASDEFSMVQTIYDNGFGDELCVLYSTPRALDHCGGSYSDSDSDE